MSASPPAPPASSSPPPLPARVRVSRLPLPPAPNVAAQLARLCPEAPLQLLQAAAVALAGGRVVGAALRWSEGEGRAEGEVSATEAIEIEAAWRGKGLEAALRASLTPE